jgi:hypothetical protein
LKCAANDGREVQDDVHDCSFVLMCPV